MLKLFHAVSETTAIGTETTMAASTAMTEAPGLSEITTKANAKTAVITVAVKRPRIQIWTYNAQGRQQEGAKLQCILQCEDGRQYCLGVAKMRNRDRSELNTLMENTWKENAVFKLTDIVLHKEKPAFIHTNYRLVIDLRSTKKTSVLQSPRFPLVPEPANTIAHILQLKETQRFDLMVLIRGIIQERTSQQGLKIMDVRLIDGSRINEEYASLPITLFFKNPSEAEDIKKYFAEQTPVNLMCLQGTYKDGQVAVAPVKDQSWVQPAAGKRSEELAQQAGNLLTNELAVKDVAALNENPASGPFDYNAEPATLMVAGLLDPTGPFIKQVLGEEAQKVFQLNLVYWTPPTQDDSITTKQGDRLFMSSAEIGDYSGKVTVAARSKAMLQAAGIDYPASEKDAMEEYTQQVNKGELRHPVLCSIRVQVQARPAKAEADSSSQSQLLDATDFGQTETQAPSSKTYNVVIVEAERIDINEWPQIPNESLQSLHTLLSLCNPGSDRILAIPLGKLQPAAFSNMTASFTDDKPVPLEKCLTLLQFTKPTNGKPHTSGIRVVGEKVRDPTAEGSDAEKYYGTVALSSIEKMGDFHISEPGTTVLAVIARVSAPAYSAHAADLHIETLQRLPPSAEVLRKVKHFMRQMQSIAETREMDPRKSDEADGPQVKCRKLWRWPTADAAEQEDPMVLT